MPRVCADGHQLSHPAPVSLTSSVHQSRGRGAYFLSSRIHLKRRTTVEQPVSYPPGNNSGECAIVLCTCKVHRRLLLHLLRRLRPDILPLSEVSYSLLICFSGMFITVDGFNKTGVPGKMWDIMEPYSQVDHPDGIAVPALVILVLSNLASHVPTVLLLGGRVAAPAAAISASDERKAWLILAWCRLVIKLEVKESKESNQFS